MDIVGSPILPPVDAFGHPFPTESVETDRVSSPVPGLPSSSAAADDTEEARSCRVELIRRLAEQIGDDRVLDAIASVPRHLFVPEVSVRRAYVDMPAPIGYGQTISQPTVVAMMTEALELTGTERVLEIGTGSGYQAAILSLLAAEVYTIELVNELAEKARGRLFQLGYRNVHVRAGDGHLGWPERAPFERILLTAAPQVMARALPGQLAEGGVMVAPVGPRAWTQRLVRYRKTGGHLHIEDLGSVAFVPMVRPTSLAM
jgi:protein-L-isoaspartate(D-aspartate) O-methyltransferase